MAFHGVLGVSSASGFVAAEVTSTVNGGGWGQLAAGSATAIVVAVIGLISVRKRRNGAAEDVNAITIARTNEANLATYRAETNLRLEGIEKALGELVDHVRPWPKERK